MPECQARRLPVINPVQLESSERSFAFLTRLKSGVSANISMMRKLNGYLIRLLVLGLLLPIITGFGMRVSSQEATHPTGRVAYLGADRNLYIYDGATDQIMTVTDDAELTRRYQYPTWSTDGRLAYFCCEFGSSDAPVLEAYVLSPDATEARMIYQATGEVFTYANWSPANNCDNVAICRQLAVLVSQLSEGEFKVELIQDTADVAQGAEAEHLNIGTGAPFYFSWSPDGSQMAWQRNNRLLDIYQLEKNSVVDTLELGSAGFPAPMWSPVDERVLFADRDPDTASVNLSTTETLSRTILTEDIGDFVAFNWSPDGQYIAYRVVQSNGYGNIEVIDASSGETVISGRDDTIAFFWSPDSSKIAYVSLIEISRSQTAAYRPLQQGDSDFALAWAVLSLDDNETTYFNNFIPTSEMIYVLTYFDQFAQSHRFWSPDSRHLVYSEFLDENTTQITILDTEDESALPFSIAEGVLGVWSY
jgi:TolB protein